MPNSNLSGYSTASKHAIAMINAEMKRKDEENAKKDAQNAAEILRKDAEMLQIRNQMSEMAKIINGMQQQPQSEMVTPTTSRGRGRGQNPARGGLAGRGGRGRGRGQTQDDPLQNPQNPQKKTMISRSETKREDVMTSKTPHQS